RPTLAPARVGHLAMIAAVVLQSLSVAAQPAPLETRFDRPRPVELRRGRGSSEFTTQTGFLSCNNVPDGDGPHELAILPNGSAVVIAHKNSNALTFFDVNAR